MNSEKTSAILFRTAHSGPQVPTSISLSNSTLELTKSCRFLGLTIEVTLDWGEHISNLCNQLGIICYTLGVLNKYLDITSLRTIYQAVFRYGIMFYGSSYNLHRVLKMKKRAFRMIWRMRRTESCRGVFRRNGLLTAPAVHIQESLIFTFKN